MTRYYERPAKHQHKKKSQRGYYASERRERELENFAFYNPTVAFFGQSFVGNLIF